MPATFDVYWLFDRTTQPPKWKMNVCLSWEVGWFLRINTSSRFRPCVPLDRARHPRLDHDSYVECVLLEFDEYELDEALRNRRNPVGRVSADLREDVLRAMLPEPYLSRHDKDRLTVLLG